MGGGLDACAGEIREAVAGVVLGFEQEDRAAIRCEKRRLERREPAENLSRDLEMRLQHWREIADPCACRDDHRSGFDHLRVRAHPDSRTEGFDAQNTRVHARYGAMTLR